MPQGLFISFFFLFFFGQYKCADPPLAHVQGVKNSFFTLKSVQKKCHNTNKSNVLAITETDSVHCIYYNV